MSFYVYIYVWGVWGAGIGVAPMVDGHVESCPELFTYPYYPLGTQLTHEAPQSCGMSSSHNQSNSFDRPTKPDIGSCWDLTLGKQGICLSQDVRTGFCRLGR